MNVDEEVLTSESSSTSNIQDDRSSLESSDWDEHYSFSTEENPSNNDIDRDRSFQRSDDKESKQFQRIVGESKPVYTWNCDRELMHREHNIINRIGWRGGHTSDQSFGQGFAGSRQAVEHLTLLKTLKHGSAFSLNFNREGNLIISSTQSKIVIWDWANNKVLHKFRPDPKNYIYKAKFISSHGCLDIVCWTYEGLVIRSLIPPSGGAPKSECLFSHSDLQENCIHQIVIVPQNRDEIMSACQDGTIRIFDLRTPSTKETIFHVRKDENDTALRSIAHHPIAPEFCVGANDNVVRVYDRRQLTKPIYKMTPNNSCDCPTVHSVVYNHNGSEILASFNDGKNFLLDSRNCREDGFLHCYYEDLDRVHFFGPRSQYIVGRNSTNIFFWDKNTEEVICGNAGPEASYLGHLEVHPMLPVLSTSYNNSGIHIWIPNGLNL
ncbi:DDB1- and CUL4-associated factor 8-like protein 2 isoform X1 [Drosophila takahashii]|uniref:DDB1- and CUL4-associated factor 8-like protein 2 isoform X1 n=1 Tax=Drosophila takahashii TaxID=29030 RepID=UPI001CF89A91|nr:DDB1- and CUL4-associated factor 8-like protein 2 [Drosophila takahashii]